MIKVEIFQSDYGYYKITAKDHSQDSKVCASVSAIMWGLAGTILNIKPSPDIKEMILNDGCFVIEINPFIEEKDQHTTNIIFTFAEIALKQIEKKYPQEIVVEDKEI